MNDDIGIELGDTSAKQPLAQTRPCEPEYAIERVGAGEPEEPEVYLSLAAVEKLLLHLRDDREREIGGVLCGQAAVDQAGKYVLVSGAVPARLAEGQRLCLTFTHEAWDDMLRDKERLYPAEAVVGWYHTHPGLGVFLSTPDQFIHRSFFGDPMEIAIVVDPRTFTWGVFHWHGEELRAVRRYFLYARPDEQVTTLEGLLSELRPEVGRRPGG